MADLLKEYSELIHEPVEMFEMEEEHFPDGTMLYVEDDPILFVKRLVARRKLIFGKMGGTEAISHVLAMSVEIRDEELKNMGAELSGRHIYETKIKKAMDVVQLTKMRELSSQGWVYKCGADIDSSSHDSITEVRL